MFTLLTIFFLQFADKAGSDVVCLSPTAMDMREARGIPLDDLDYAVSPIYLDSVKAMGAKVLHTSRWLNGATVEASAEAMSQIAECDFVDTVWVTRRSVEHEKMVSASQMKQTENEDWPEMILPSVTKKQLEVINLLPLHEAGYRGLDIRIGIADGGFYHADSMASLPHEQYLGYADLTDCEHDIFAQEGKHGSLCLSAIVGRKKDYEGAATEASYFLFRTEEHYTESPKEIDNWVAAIEMADSLGLHIVSTSLGYTTFDEGEEQFSYTDMDGRTSRGAQAACIAARKGLLLVVAMGNEGNKEWHYISTPADADSVLSVGAVDEDKIIAPFSSYGPTADGRVKPEVCAVGDGSYLIDPASGTVTQSKGTSFACPLIAGMAACLWSAMPKASNMEIRDIIMRSCDRYAEGGDEQYGYGVPDAWKAYLSSTTNVGTIMASESGVKDRKILRNGHLYILHNGKRYNLLGNRIECEETYTK